MAISIKLSTAWRRMFLKGVFGAEMSSNYIYFNTSASGYNTLIHTTAAATRYLFAYGNSTYTATLTQVTNPVTWASTGYTGLERLNTTAATIAFKFSVTSIASDADPNCTVVNMASSLITIPAGKIVYYVGMFASTAPTSPCLAWIRLSNPNTGYNYTEQGTLRIPAGGYAINFPL